FNFVDGDGDFFQVAVLVVGNVAAGGAVAFQGGQLGQVVFRFGRTGFFHGGDHVPGAIVGVRSVNTGLSLEAGLVVLGEFFASRHGGQRHTSQGRVSAVGGIASQTQEGVAACHFTRNQRCLDVQRLHLTLHGAGLRIEATKEDGIGCLGLDVGQNGGEVVGFVRGVFTGHDLATCFFYRTGNLVSQTLAVSGTVVDQGHFLGRQILDDELAHSRTLLGVAGHHAEGVVVTLLSVLRGSCHGD